MAMETNDNILFEQIQQDNQQALEVLFKKYYTSLCLFAKTFLKRSDLSEEVVADVFFKLWENRKKIQINSHLKAYLYIAIKNESLNVLNKKEFNFEDIDLQEISHSEIRFLAIIMPTECKAFFGKEIQRGFPAREPQHLSIQQPA